ncbi:MAG: tripartite tricarboxylate transporter substrate binding protein [Lachnospiraceae bacterium]|nr:tripartite tricarboxylate transporter substrate binding protein [Lachnospiraceae bacterium]
MMKKVLTGLLSVGLAFSLVACGSSTGGASSPTDDKKETTESDTSEESQSESASISDWKPSGAVTIICPYGAGGGQDVAARLFAQYATEIAGVSFVVDNQTGGSGTIGNTAIASAKPDGQTLGMFHNLSYYDEFTTEGVAYNADSFTQLCAFTADASIIVVNKSLGVTDLKGLMELAKNQNITWGGPEFSSQTYPRISMEALTGESFGHMVFDGGATSLAAVAGGNCNVTSVFPSEYATMETNENIVPIAVTGEERMEAYPDIPTMIESGYDTTFSQIRSICIPANADAAVVAYYDNICKQVLDNAEFQKSLQEGGFAPINYVGEAAAAYMQETYDANIEGIIEAVEAVTK